MNDNFINSEFCILIASDIHLGYAEKDQIRSDDSFRTFEEVLQIALDQKVDFLLLGGDLFHENRPSPKSMKKCLELLRKYTMGDGVIKFKVVSDQQVNFSHSDLFRYINYEDENLNIKLPIFSIHGNHDDPTGKDAVGVLDTLAATGLINYFGKQLNIDCIEVSPVLLKKGKIQIALYGIGSLPEERFHRYIVNHKVTFLEMEQDDKKEWFNIFVVHQNRVKHGNKYLPENCLTDLPDLVIWGHEHECIKKIDYNEEKNFYIYQPGSTVATSLSVGESKKKHCGLLKLKINNLGEYKSDINFIALKTVRPFYFESVSLSDYFFKNNKKNPVIEDVEKFCTNKIEELIMKSKKLNENNSLLPLIRLRLEYSNDYLLLSSYHFGQKFTGKVANPKDLILFKCKNRSLNSNKSIDVDLNSIEDIYNDEEIKHNNINDVIKEYFESTDEKNKLNLLSENKLTEVIKEIVDKEQNSDKLSTIIDWHMQEVCKFIESKGCLNEILKEPELVIEIMQDFKDDVNQMELKHQIAVKEIESKYKAKINKINLKKNSDSDDENDKSTIIFDSEEEIFDEENIEKKSYSKKVQPKVKNKKKSTIKNKSINDYIIKKR